MTRFFSEKTFLYVSLLINLVLLVVFLIDSKKAPLLFPNSDFEEGTLANWTPSGEAFLGQPVQTILAEKRKGKRFHGVGKYSVCTYEKTAKRAAGDGPVGELISAPFKITGSRIIFRMGAGNNTSQTSVQLLIDEKPVLEDRGRATITQVEAMVPVVWEVSRWQGKTGRIKILDLSNKGWGHINVDDFRMQK